MHFAPPCYFEDIFPKNQQLKQVPGTGARKLLQRRFQFVYLRRPTRNLRVNADAKVYG